MLGVKRILRIGTCGGLQPDLALGDLIVAISAVPQDATALHYLGGEPHVPTADWDLVHAAVHAAKESASPFASARSSRATSSTTPTRSERSAGPTAASSRSRWRQPSSSRSARCGSSRPAASSPSATGRRRRVRPYHRRGDAGGRRPDDRARASRDGAPPLRTAARLGGSVLGRARISDVLAGLGASEPGPPRTAPRGRAWPEIAHRAAAAGLEGEALFSEGPAWGRPIAERAAGMGAKRSSSSGATARSTRRRTASAPSAPGASSRSIPRGTGTDFVRTFGIPGKLDEAIVIARDGRIREIDAGRVSYRPGTAPGGALLRQHRGAGMSGAVAMRRELDLEGARRQGVLPLGHARRLRRWQRPEGSVDVDDAHARAACST